MSKINLGVIGTSEIVQEHLRVINNIKDFKLYGITSRTNKNSNFILNKFKFKKKYKSYIEMAKDKNIKALLIVVSADQSYSVIKDIIKFKKPFFCEKPAGSTLKESRYLKSLSIKFKTLNMVGFNRRYYSVIKTGLDIINKNGGIRAINVEGHERYWIIKSIINKKLRKKWALVNNIHMVDLLLFFGGAIKKYSIFSKSYDEKFNNYINFSFEFNNSIIGNYSSYWNSPGGWSVVLYGKKITVVFNPLEKGYWIDEKMKKHLIKPNKFDKKFKPGFFLQMNDFLKLIQRKKNNAHNLITSYNSMKIGAKIFN